MNAVESICETSSTGFKMPITVNQWPPLARPGRADDGDQLASVDPHGDTG